MSDKKDKRINEGVVPKKPLPQKKKGIVPKPPLPDPNRPPKDEKK